MKKIVIISNNLNVEDLEEVSKMMRRDKELSVVVAAVLLMFNNSCGKNDDENHGGPFSGNNPITPMVDVSSAVGLLVVDTSKPTSRVEMHNRHAQELGTRILLPTEIDSHLAASSSTDGTGSLKKTDSSGNVSSAISTPGNVSSSSSGCCQPTLPMISTIAVSPIKEIFVHFANPFRHKQATSTQATQGNPWTDGTHCQLFRVKGGTVSELQAKAPTAANLECLDYTHFVNNWQAQRTSVFQFDSTGNVYFPGQIPDSPKMVVYKWNRATGQLSELINSNICVQDFLVTQSGGLFYTGTSSCNGGPSASGGFFRYVSGSGTLTEIARDWWNFIYEPVSTATTDKAVFFGPDPTISTTASWNTACIFYFDPNGGSTTAARTSSAITCGSDIWSWVQMSRTEDIATYGQGYTNNQTASSAYKTEFQNRCTSSGQVFAGGGSQISAIKQNSAGNVFVIGNVRKKNAGTLTCDLEVRGPHCKLNGMPNVTYTSSATCTSAGGFWLDEGRCANGTSTTSAACFTATQVWTRDSVWYNQVSTSICTASGEIAASNWWSGDNSLSFQTATNDATNVLKFKINYFNCAPPSSTGGDQWTSEYRGLAKVVSASKTLSLLSGTSQQAINLWIVSDKVYYSAFDSTSGQYKLFYYDGTSSTELASNFEVYNLNASGIADGSLYFDGLDFSNNSYTFGTIQITSPYTRTQKTGLTGTLKTIVILSN